ncbi:MAG: anthranilate phosphoribosyltransferase [Rickettsiales bacterium]|nr:anthranilate phosphoribosyltransferase [Rickettsiales bacterium]
MNLQNLTSQNFEEIFSDIIEQKISETETKKILLDLNKNGYSKESFIGAVTALKKRMIKISAPKNSIDVCGTGGDKLNTLNVSTAVCFLVAAAGISVAKHGNKAVSSMSGSADIFSELGIKISSDIAEIEKTLAEKKLCFLFAPFFHQSLKNLAQIRKSFAEEFKQLTIFNFLGPLLNPANTRFQLIGTSRKDTMRNMLEVAAADDASKKIYIVHGFDGMDEITLCNDSYLLRFENGKFFEEEIINPEKFGFKKVVLEALKGSDAKHNAQKLIALLDGEKSAYRDIVLLNSAYAFKISGKVEKITDGIDLAREMIDSGKAKQVLQSLIV